MFGGSAALLTESHSTQHKPLDLVGTVSGHRLWLRDSYITLQRA